MLFVYPRNTNQLRARYKVYVREIELEFGVLVFEDGRKPENPEKNPLSNQTQPTYDAGSGNRTWVTLVGGERSHHCTIPAPHKASINWVTVIPNRFAIDHCYCIPCRNVCEQRKKKQANNCGRYNFAFTCKLCTLRKREHCNVYSLESLVCRDFYVTMSK